MCRPVCHTSELRRQASSFSTAVKWSAGSSKRKGVRSVRSDDFAQSCPAGNISHLCSGNQSYTLKINASISMCSKRPYTERPFCQIHGGRPSGAHSQHTITDGKG